MKGQTQIFKAFPQRIISRNIDNALPAMKGERQQVYINKLSRVPENIQAYNTFNSTINMYLTKLPNNFARNSVESIMKRDLVYICRSILPQKNGILGGVAIDSQNRIAGLLVDSVDLNIGFETGIMPSPDEVLYGIYFQYIRAIILSQSDKIKSDKELHRLMISHFKGLILKAIGKTVYLFDKQQEILTILVSYIYYRFQLGKLHDESVEMALVNFPKLKDETKEFFKIAIKYKTANDIFIGLTDFRIITESPNKIIIDSIQLFNLSGYYSMTTSIDYLIGFAILSKYPIDFFKNGLINAKLSDNIESLIIKKYASKLKFNLTGLS